MEGDDEFGDLYTDVLGPLTTSFTPQPHPSTQSIAANTPQPLDRPIDLNILTDAEGTPVVAPDSNRISRVLLDGLDSKAWASDSSRAMAYGDPNLLDESGIDIVVEETDARGDIMLETNENVTGRSENVEKLMDGNCKFSVEEADTGIRDLGLETTIPGLSSIGGSVAEDEKLMSGSENTGNLTEQNAAFDNLKSAIPGISDGRNGDDSDSDSEDDLQIVLNDDNNDRNVLMDRNNNYDDDDEDEEPLVIVADDGDVNKQQLMEEQEWGAEAADGEKKELDDAAKANGGASVAPKIGYSNHGYHPYHSQFKYVRPGAATIPGTTPIGSGGAPGQVRPMVNMGPIGGRGRGDWRPAGMKNAPPMQKGFHTGYGMSVFGSNATGHGFGGGLEFTLPSHKTVFEVDIDGFEEKLWRLPGIDISDYFNFGLNEESWKEYCKKLEQLRLEATMQSKIRVYESGRTEQEYDPDMPPELAAAAGIRDVPPDNATLIKMGAGQTDILKGPRLRPPPPTGRAIQVESGYGERLPSIDTRPPRIRDSDAIIEIVLQDSFEDNSYQENNITERPEIGLFGDGFRGGNEIDEDVQQEETEHSDGFSHAYDDERRHIGRKAPVMKTLRDDMVEGDEISPFLLESPRQYNPDSSEHTPESPRRNFGVPQEQRGTKERRTPDRFLNVTPTENTLGTGKQDDQKEESVERINSKYSPLLSSPVTAKCAGRKIERNDVTQDELLLEDGNSEMEKDEMTLNTSTTNDGFKDEKLSLSKKQMLSSRLEQPSSQEIDDREDSKAARSSENSKARSGSSRDFQKSRDSIEEVTQDGLSTSLRNAKRPVSINENSTLQRSYHEKQETERHRMTLKGREDTYSRRELGRNSAHYLHMKSDVSDRQKESDNTDGAWQHRNEDPLGRRSRAEETRKREHSVEVGSRRHSKVGETERSDRDENHQSRKQLENRTWTGHHDKDVGSRHRDWDDSFRGRNEGMDYVHGKRRKDDSQVRRDHFEKEESMHVCRESSSRRKRERDDILDQRKKDDQTRLRDDDQHYIRQKEEAMFGKDKVERQREREEWHRFKQSREDILSKREREEGRGSRSGRTVEEKASIGHSRVKDDYKGSDKEFYLKDTGRRVDQVKRRDRVENEHISQQRGHEDVYPRGNQLSNDERRSRHDRGSARYDRVVNSSDNHRMYENKHKDEKRKGKGSEDGINSLTSSKRKQEDHIYQKSEMVSLKGTIGQKSGEHEIPVNRQSSKSHKAGVSSDDEQQDSRRGRSKLERWTSHKEMDFSMTTKSLSSSKFKEIETHANGEPSLTSKPEESSRILDTSDNQRHKEKDAGDPESNNVDVKALEDKHLDTVAKLKKRSERFKLPLASEKEDLTNKKMETEPLPSIQSETRMDSEIKHERPARKRRWTSN